MSYEPENPTSDIGDDAQRWLFAEFERISEEIILLRQELVLAGYGGLRLDSPPVAGPDIVLNTWQVLSQYDALLTPNPRFIEQDIANNGLIVKRAGIYEVNLNFEFAHNQDNALARRIFVQLYNGTDQIPGQSLTIDTAIRSSNTVRYVAFQFEVLPASVDKLYQVRLGNGSAYTNVVWNIQSFTVFHTSEAKG
jgi:hypothetical protein